MTTISLQAVGGLVLAAVGFPFDDATAGNYSDLASPALVAELTYNGGPTANDVPLLSQFPYQAEPHRGYDYVKQLTAVEPIMVGISESPIGVGVPKAFILEQNYPNPFNPSTTIKYHVSKPADVRINVYNTLGQLVATLVDGQKAAGTYSINWDAKNLASGTYFYQMEVGNDIITKKSILVK
ncbi:MAG: T9SS type A sorting domain-containing protein [Calditrichia bacterium]